MKFLSLATLCALVLSLGACKKGGGGINFFTIKQDKEFGQQLKQEIEGNPSEYPVLPYTGNEQAYQYLYDMRDEILASDDIRYRDEFGWELYIIDDEVLNAFAAPGGYMYVYTGLIKYLDKADHLAGVIGHEIAHADRRHSTEQLTKQYGISVLLEVLVGNNPGLLADIATGLVSLSFSRADETESDEYSVKYLCDTKYASDGAAGFFEKLIQSGQSGSTPAFLSTHPSPDNRVQNIRDNAKDAGCSTTDRANAGWTNFQALF